MIRQPGGFLEITLVIFCKKGVYKKSEPQICPKLRNQEEMVQPKISRKFRNFEAKILKMFVTQASNPTCTQ